ncbi:MAG: alpha/beta fold hydrolase [Lentisphaerae bacterium]|nr:alpha/beta fold hydrolase [Lentisphaerota bacterium]
MNARMRRAFLLPAGIAVAALVALNLLALNHARAMMRFTTGGKRTPGPEALSIMSKATVLVTGVNVPRPGGGRHPSELSPRARVVRIAAGDGDALEAWHHDAGRDTPLVLLFHGYATDKTLLIPEANAFIELGTSVLLVDFRGSGGSSGSTTTIGVEEAEDVAACVRYARNSLPCSGLVLFGQSMGAAAILRAFDKHGVTADAVVLEAVFDTMLNTVRNRFHAMHVPSFPSAELLVFWGGAMHGFNGFRHRPVDCARALTCPALFMHGSDDPRATFAEGRRVFEAASGPKTFVRFDSVGHEAYVTRNPGQWNDAVRAFLVSSQVIVPTECCGRPTGRDRPSENASFPRSPAISFPCISNSGAAQRHNAGGSHENVSSAGWVPLSLPRSSAEHCHCSRQGQPALHDNRQQVR